MSQRVILVSGANKGIGLEVVILLSNKFPQDIVLLGTRDLKNGEQAIKQSVNESNSLSNVKLIQLDVTNPDSIKAAVDKVDRDYGRLDILINNSGIAVSEESRQLAESVLDVNVTGVQRMNDAFLPSLLKSTNKENKPLIIVVGSEVGAWFNHCADKKLQQFILAPEKWTKDTVAFLVNDYIASFDDNASTAYSWKLNQGKLDFKIYCVSKAIVTGYSRWFAHKHPEINLAIVTPGYCATDINGFSGYRSALQGGESVFWPITNKFESGHFYRDGEEHPWTTAPQF